MSTPPFRYQNLGYVALNVTNLARSKAFYQDIVGLECVAETDRMIFFRCGSDHHDLVLYVSSSPGLKRVAWELEREDDLGAAYDYFSRAGMAPVWLDGEEQTVLRQGKTFRLRQQASGICFEYYANIMQMTAPFTPTLAQIARLGHVVVSVRQFERVLDQLMSVWNFRLSDTGEGVVAFLRCFPNPLHHSFAIQNGSEDRLHHVNFMVTSMDDIGRAVNRLNKHQVPIVFGPGRHLPSGSIFLYFLDPDGMTVEYSFGMEEFPEDKPRKPRILEPKLETIDMWGGRPAAGFGAVGAIESV